MIDKNTDVVQICGGSLVEIQPLITADSRLENYNNFQNESDNAIMFVHDLCKIDYLNMLF